MPESDRLTLYRAAMRHTEQNDHLQAVLLLRGAGWFDVACKIRAKLTPRESGVEVRTTHRQCVALCRAVLGGVPATA